MKEIILRCDRCKEKTEELITFSFVNKNVEQEEDVEKEKQSPFFFPMFMKGTKHPTIEGDICFDCFQELTHWLGHSENILKKRAKT